MPIHEAAIRDGAGCARFAAPWPAPRQHAHILRRRTSHAGSELTCRLPERTPVDRMHVRQTAARRRNCGNRDAAQGNDLQRYLNAWFAFSRIPAPPLRQSHFKKQTFAARHSSSASFAATRAWDASPPALRYGVLGFADLSCGFCTFGVPDTTTMSTRRFALRPSAVSLLAAG